MSTPGNNWETIVARTQCFFDHLQDERTSKEMSFSTQDVSPCASNAAIYDEIAQLKDQLQIMDMSQKEFR